MAIGELLQELRKDRGLSQKEIGKLMNLDPTTIGAYETGKNEPSLSAISFFAKFYGVSADYLLGLTRIRVPWSETVNRISSNNKISVKLVEEYISELTLLSPKNRAAFRQILKALCVESKFSDKKNI